MKSKTSIFCALIGILSGTLSAVPPTIHVAWEETIPPVLGENYNVITLPPASADYPNVELVTGSLTWRIWSTDPDNPGGFGDIGVISSPHPQNFAVTILDNLGNPGASFVSAMILDPTDSSNRSSIADGSHTTGDLEIVATGDNTSAK